MSGGSFNYLFAKETADFIMGRIGFDTLERMKDRLVELNYPSISNQTELIYNKIKDLMSEYHKLDSLTYTLQREWRIADDDNEYRDEIGSFNLDYIIDCNYFPESFNDIKLAIKSNISEEKYQETVEYEKRVKKLLSDMIEMDSVISPISSVWKSVEWYDSMDSGIDYVESESKKYIERIEQQA